MTLIEEMITAGRGVVALIAGRRNAPSYFNLTMVGLVGSFIAFAITAGINTHAAQLIVDMVAIEEFQLPPEAAPAGWLALLAIVITYAIKMGFAALALNWMKRLDGFVPFLIASNWVDFFTIVVGLALSLLGLAGSGVVTMGFILVAFLAHINVARLIVTLRPMQIVFFLVTQMFGTFIVLTVLTGLLAPVPVAS